MSKSKLIFKGSSGCIFRPQIPCENSKKKRTKKRVSKLFIKKNKEYKIGLKVKKIKGYSDWTILWENVCQSPEYEKLLKESDINECLISQNIRPETLPQNYKFTLYQGSYGGLTFENYSRKVIKQNIFNSEELFIKMFKKIFKLLHNIFYGLMILNKHNICHHDINRGNILIKNNQSYIIDYDISLEMNNLKDNSFLTQRMREEFNGTRIYDIYPYEYIYYILKDKDEILNEQKNIALYQNRLNYYEDYEPIHHKLFNRDTDNLRFELLEDKLMGKKMNLDLLINKLDVYSLGMSILILFIERCEDYNIKTDECIRLFKLKDLKPYMDLIKDMTEFNYKDRISIEEAYERYKNLI
jgi:serine/threonine protein kinase